MASEEEVNITLRTIGDTSGAQQVSSALQQTQRMAQQTQQALNGAQEAANSVLRAHMAQQGATLENFNKLSARIAKGFGTQPTLTPQDFGLTGAAAAPGEPGGPSQAFAELMKAQQRQLAGGTDPQQAALEKARREQLDLQIRLNDEAERQYLTQQKASQQLEAGLARRLAAQGDVQNLAPGDDPQAQARLFAARGAQQRQFDQLIQERTRAANRGAILPTEGMPQRAVDSLRAAEAATRGLGGAMTTGATNMLRFGGSLVGLGIGLSIYTTAGQALHQAVQTFVDDEVKLEQARRENTLALGQQSAAFQAWASMVSRQANVTQREVLEAGTAVAQFARQVGMGPGQVEDLTAVATLLARIRGEDVGATMNTLTAAMQGNAGAAQQLGLQLDAAYIAYTRLDGASANVFNQLSASTQAWLRYQSAVEQAARQSQAGSGPVAELGRAAQAWGVEVERLANDVIPAFLTAVGGVVQGATVVFRTMNDIRQFNMVLFAELTRAAQDAGGAIGDALGVLASGAGDAVGEWLGRLGEGVQMVPGTLGDAFSELSAAVQTAGGQIGSVIDTIVTGANEAAGALNDAIGGAVESIINQVPGAASVLEALFAGIGQLAAQGLNTLGQATEGMFKLLAAAAAQTGGALETVLTAFRDTVATVGNMVTQVNQAIKSATGVDVLGDIGGAINEAGVAAQTGIDKIRKAIDDLATAAPTALASLASTAGSVFDGLGAKIDEIRRKAAEPWSEAMEARAKQIATMAEAAVGPLLQLTGARNAEIAAAQTLDKLKEASVQSAADEARIRLGMLPQQQQMLQLTNQINRAQLEMTQRALPATRELQDLQNQIEAQRLVAIDPTRGFGERQGAQQVGAGLELQMPRAQLAALQANMAGLPTQRAAQDVQLASQLQALDLAAKLMPTDFIQQQIALLTTIASAVKDAATRAVEIAIQGVNIIINQVGEITAEDEKRIVELIGEDLAKVFHAAVVQTGNRPAPNALIGAT